MSQSLRRATTSVETLTRGAEGANRTLRALSRQRVNPTISLRDRATRAINRIQQSLRDVGRRRPIVPVAVRDMATASIERINFGLRRLGVSYQFPTVGLIDRATKPIRSILGVLSRIDTYVATAAVRVRVMGWSAIKQLAGDVKTFAGKTYTAAVAIKDKATPVLQSIEARAQSLRQSLTGALGAVGISGGAVTSQAFGASRADSLTAAQTGLSRQDVTSIVDQNYYSGNGASREIVNEIVTRVAQQTDLQGDELRKAVEVATRLSTLNPEADANELVRPLTAQLNAQNVAFERTADALTYLRKEAGDQYDDLYDTFTEYATTMSKNGISPERLVSGLLQAQRAGGWNYDAPVDALREWGIRTVTSLDKNAVDAMADVLGEAKTKQLYMGLKKGEIDAFGFLSEVAKGLDKIENPIKKNLAQVALYGTMFEDNDKAVSEFFNGLMKTTDTTGALNDSYTKLKENDPTTPLVNAWLKLKDITKGVGDEIITNVTPALSEFTAWASSEEGSKAIDEFTQRIGELAAVVGGSLADAIQWTITNWSDVEPVITKVAIALGAIAVLGPAFRIIGDSITVMKGMGSVVKYLTTFIELGNGAGLLTIASRMGLVGLAVLGVVAAVTAAVEIWKNWDEWTSVFTGENLISALNSIGTAVDGVIEKVKTLISNFFTLQQTKVNPDGSVTPGQSPLGAFTSTVTEANNSASGVIQNGLSDSVPGYRAFNNWVSDHVPGFDVGLQEVPRNNMLARLHEGEMVVPREEAKMIREMASGGSSSTPTVVSGGSGNGDIILYHYGDINNGADAQAMYRDFANQLREEQAKSSEGGHNFAQQ